MRRRAVMVLVWVLGTVASVALAWFAVSAVGGEVTSTPDAGVAAAPATSTTIAPSESTSSSSSTTAPQPASTATTAVIPSPTTTATTAAPPPPSQPRSDVFESAGGTVGATCTGATASLDFATPRAGYAAEVHDAGPEKVDVRFEAPDETESRLIVRCSSGVPTAVVEEDSDSNEGSDDD